MQLVNKFDGLLFTKNDENFVEAFAIFCGMGIHNTHMYEKAITAMAKQSVTLDVSIFLIIVRVAGNREEAGKWEEAFFTSIRVQHEPKTN